MSLSTMKVLLTRPEGQGDNLKAAIKQQGGQSIHYPVMAIQPLDPLSDQLVWQQTKDKILNLDQYQQLVFISTNAVRFGTALIEQYWPQLPVGIQWHGIGSATVKALLAAGIPCADSDRAMNTEALLQQPALQALSEQRVLIVRGVGGREALAEGLRERGARVHYAECYRRARVDKPVGELGQLLQTERVNSMVINSGETLQYVCDLLGGQLPLTLPVIVPGNRVAGLAEQRGFSNIVRADNASTPAIIEALLSVAKHQQ